MKNHKIVNVGMVAIARNGLLIMVLCMLSWSGAAAELFGVVAGVSDGDTIQVRSEDLRQHTVRLMGIDAPEKAQDFGRRSKQFLSDQVYGRIVKVEWAKTDKYGRIVGKVSTKEGRDICLEQISQGMAWHYSQYADEQSADDRRLYSEAERSARGSRLGLWQDPAPVPPWVWRRSTGR